MRKTRRFLDHDTDPLSGMANLFDLAMVFAVALMVALTSYFKMTDFLMEKEFTLVKNPGKKNMEVIVKKDKTVTKYKASETSGIGKGKRVGIAYEMENGEIIYIPE